MLATEKAKGPFRRRAPFNGCVINHVGNNVPVVFGGIPRCAMIESVVG